MLITKPVQYSPDYISFDTSFQSIDVEQKLSTRSMHSCLLICKVLADLVCVYKRAMYAPT